MNEKTLSKENGQSLVLVAAAMVILVLFVAITVDVSSAYYNRRTAQNAADGAALAGASRLATQINNRKKLDKQIQEDMNDFAERNGIVDTDGGVDLAVNDNVDGWYVDTLGNRLSGEPMVGAGSVPEGAYGVEAITYITAPTYFGGIFGISGLPLDARAVSQVKLACSSDCLVPITTDLHLLLDESGNARDTCFHIWQERVKDPDDISSGVLGWVSWTWQEEVCSNSELSCYRGPPCPKVDQGINGCQEGVLEANINPSHCASGYVKVGDWVSAATGDMNSKDVRCWLSYYVGYVDPNISDVCSDGFAHSFTIPVYDENTADLGGSSTPCLRMTDSCDYTKGGGLHYRVAGFAQMQVLQYQLSAGQEYPPDGDLDPGDLAYIDSCTNWYDFSCDPVLDPGCDIEALKKEGFRITVEFIEYVQDFSTSDDCYDPEGTLWSSPKLTE